ncbi:4-hydroxythreonine-4-phosphate dehydrogenase PdxA [Rhodopila sp.]|jgi:4-hydroxythreonine-4-phosphate dehydrogenase|uniref:4-hydroxythreonine-4-phosphate dehydrogenase PdxA n=1 Tax=Rhodopila sp. TaxID=2480087 RepID=UPI002C81B495|nr:4-hydroxythreonine-4-phosphate dehydrogenase PdxA [Rhodopila sp.]HVZ06881.1 4-hydroxythreonine-4-phosphate dehydrogenase PdxA [Rhodopila sp.]
MEPLALTMGCPAGIGGELTLRAWLDRRATGPVFVALDDADRLAALAGQMGLDVPVRPVASPSQAVGVFPAALPVLPVPLAEPVVPGRPSKANAGAVVRSIELATGLALRGEAAAVVTNPINKAALYDAGFAYPGHTEFLAHLTGASGRQIMMLASPTLRVVPVTVHASLRDSIAMLSTEMIVAAARTTATALRRDFGLARPRLAMAGLNPHAGEKGALGREEATLIEPAIAVLRADGIDVSGPWPPDTMFTAKARARYDAAICMYHDQALIPLKTLDMEHGVNVTLGLPIVRTSPDHGTAYDIAGKGLAEPTSLLAALDLAAQLGVESQSARAARSGGG